MYFDSNLEICQIQEALNLILRHSQIISKATNTFDMISLHTETRFLRINRKYISCVYVCIDNLIGGIGGLDNAIEVFHNGNADDACTIVEKMQVLFISFQFIC